MSVDSLEDTAVVVTGAGKGIGRALARRLAAEGARVVVNDVDVDACAAVAQEIGAFALPGDAAGADAVIALIAGARSHLGEIDIFFANAGIETGGRDGDEDWQRSWEVNVMSHVRAFRELAPNWLARGRGRFVPTVSAAGLLTMLGAAPYAATKHAALAHAEWLSATYGDKGITVQCICPQGVRTDMVRLDTAEGQLLLAPTLIEPEEVAQVVVEALAGEKFLILPHPEVAKYYELRARHPDRWLQGMRGIQQQIDRGRPQP